MLKLRLIGRVITYRCFSNLLSIRVFTSNTLIPFFRRSTSSPEAAQRERAARARQAIRAGRPVTIAIATAARGCFAPDCAGDAVVAARSQRPRRVLHRPRSAGAPRPSRTSGAAEPREPLAWAVESSRPSIPRGRLALGARARVALGSRRAPPSGTRCSPGPVAVGVCATTGASRRAS